MGTGATDIGAIVGTSGWYPNRNPNLELWLKKGGWLKGFRGGGGIGWGRMPVGTSGCMHWLEFSGGNGKNRGGWACP